MTSSRQSRRPSIRNTELDWPRFVDAAAAIVNCGLCLEYAEGEPGSPQPSWVGRDYAPGGVVFVLQNSAVPGIRDRDASGELLPGPAQREASLARLLVAFRTAASAESYHDLVGAMHRWMQGKDGAGNPWTEWSRRVSKSVEGCVDPERIAWVNIVKYRTPGNRRPGTHEFRHGREHLRVELEALRPSMIVSVGGPAREALRKLGVEADEHIAQRGSGSGARTAYAIRDRLKAAGLCGGGATSPVARE